MIADPTPYIRPSSLSAIEICPGRPVMEARAIAACPAIESLRRPAADQGTAGHMVVAQTLALTYHQPGGWVLPADALAQTARLMAAMEPWSQDAARRCFAYAVALVDMAVQEGFEVVIEVEVSMSGRAINIPRGGTADLVLVLRRPGEDQPVRAIVADWKMGFLDQGHAADHLQLAAYAAMAWGKYRPKEGVVVHLAQGRRRDFSSAHYAAGDIAAVTQRIHAAIAAAWAPEPPLRPRADACRYCRSLLLCRAAREAIMHAKDPHSICATDNEGRAETADVAAIARRFAEDAKEMAKVWQRETATNG